MIIFYFTQFILAYSDYFFPSKNRLFNFTRPTFYVTWFFHRRGFVLFSLIPSFILFPFFFLCKKVSEKFYLRLQILRKSKDKNSREISWRYWCNIWTFWRTFPHQLFLWQQQYKTPLHLHDVTALFEHFSKLKLTEENRGFSKSYLLTRIKMDRSKAW